MIEINISLFNYQLVINILEKGMYFIIILFKIMYILVFIFGDRRLKTMYNKEVSEREGMKRICKRKERGGVKLQMGHSSADRNYSERLSN